MRESNGVELDTFPSAMGIITRLACGRAKQEGIEVNDLLRKAGLTHQQIDDPRARLPVKAQIKFLDLAAITLNDECLGFHLAQKFDLRMIGLLHYVLASSDTLDEALERAARYSAIVNEGITLRFREGKNIGISFEYAGVARHSDCHQIEFAMVTLLRTCRLLWLLGYQDVSAFTKRSRSCATTPRASVIKSAVAQFWRNATVRFAPIVDMA